MEECQRLLGGREVWLNRGDIGLGQEKVMAWHERKVGRPHFLLKLKLTANVRRAMAALPEESWQGPAQWGVLQVAEGRLRLPGWSRERRVVFGRRLLGIVPKEKSGTFWEENQHEFEAYITDLEPKRLADRGTLPQAGRCRERLRRTQKPVGLRRVLLAQARSERTGHPFAAAGLQPLESLPAPDVTRASYRSGRRQKMIFAHRRQTGSKRPPESASNLRNRWMVESAQRRLQQALPLAGNNCAAVGKISRWAP